MFIDELDAVGGRRDSFRGSNSRQTINQLLNELEVSEEMKAC